MRRSLTLFLLSLLIWVPAVIGDSTRTPFGSMSVTLTGDITQAAEFTVSFQARASGTYKARLRLPEGIAVAPDDPIEVSAAADSGETVATGWTVSGSADGYYVLQAEASADIPSDTLGTYARYDACPYYLEIGDDVVKHSAASAVPPPFAGDDSVITYTPVGTAQNIDVTVTGRVGYVLSTICFNADGFRGIPGLAVYMDWGADNDPRTLKYPPEQPPFVKTNMDGQFQFNFSFASDSLAHQITSRIRLWVKTSNIAALGENSSLKYPWFVEHGTLNISGATTSVDFDSVEIQVEPRYGAPLRYFYRARKFYRADLGDEQLPAVLYKYQSDGTTHFYHNPITGTHNIVLTSVPESETAYHEYGHYVDYKHGGLPTTTYGDNHSFAKVTTPNTAWKEGWAEYFSAVCNEYWHALEAGLGIEENDLTYIYQFLDHAAHRRLATTVAYHDRYKVEGVIASILYSCHDSYLSRANGYVGDNDDARVIPRRILREFTEAEVVEYPGWYDDLLQGLLASVDEPARPSVSAVWNYYMHGEGIPRAATPTTLSVIAGSGGTTLGWNSNGWPDRIRVTSDHCDEYDPLYYRPNHPTGFRVYRRPGEQAWDGTLDDYQYVTSVTYPNLAWQDDLPTDQPASYVVVAYNASGRSTPKAEGRIVPPAYFDEPAGGAEVADRLNIIASIKALPQISGYPLTSELDSFVVEWGNGSSPSLWRRYGVDYLVSQTSAVSHATIATWNTGVVQSGTYTIRLTAYYGYQSYETRRIVGVEHRSQLVDASAWSFRTIHEGLSWAQMGDTIRVGPGVYANTATNPTLILKETVQIIGTGPSVEIRPYGNSPIVSVTDHKYPATLDGLTFKRVTDSTTEESYGVRVWNSSVRFRKCSFIGMQAYEGYAIYATGSSKIDVEGCLFEGNEPFPGHVRGSVVVMWTGPWVGKPTGSFVDCVFRENEGKAVSIIYDYTSPLQGSEPKPYFDGCTFENNRVVDNVVQVDNSLRTINFFNCSFVDNEVMPRYGSPQAAIYCNNAKVWLDNCTIARNVQYDPYGYGQTWDVGGVSINDSSPTLPVTIDDSIIAFNAGPVVNMTDAQMPADVTLTRSIVYGNTTGLGGGYRSDTQWALAGTVVFAENPAFCNSENGDYHLYACSPAAAGPHFAEKVGALDIGCVPDAVLTVLPGEAWGPSDVTLGCPAGDLDSLEIRVVFADTVMTGRTIQPKELSIEPPYLSTGIYSDQTILGDTPASAPDYVMTLGHKYISGYGTDSITVYLNGYPLAQKALVKRRGPDMKSSSPPGCGGDLMCPDGRVDFSDFIHFSTHYPTYANPNPPYHESCDFVAPFGPPVEATDFSFFGAHYLGGHQHPFSSPLLGPEVNLPTASTQVVLGFTEEYVTAVTRRLLVDVTLENCAGVNCCLFAIRANRPDLALASWQPSEWAAKSAPFAPIDGADGQELLFGVIMFNDTGASSRHLGQLVFDVEGSAPLSIAEDEFVLTRGDLAFEADNPGGNGPATFAQMSGVLGRTSSPAVQQVFHNRLEQNYPNPFNPQTTIAFSIKEGSDVDLTIYDVAGRRVRELVDEHRARGAYKVVWDGRNGNGNSVASGVYFCKLVAGPFTDTKKLTILK